MVRGNRKARGVYPRLTAEPPFARGVSSTLSSDEGGEFRCTSGVAGRLGGSGERAGTSCAEVCPWGGLLWREAGLLGSSVGEAAS
jgi:hypothetical protein